MFKKKKHFPLFGTQRHHPESFHFRLNKSSTEILQFESPVYQISVRLAARMLVLLLADETRMSGRADAVSARRFGRSFALLLQTVVLALVTQRTTANAAVTFAAVQRAARLSHTSIADAQRMRLGQNALVIQ